MLLWYSFTIVWTIFSSCRINKSSLTDLNSINRDECKDTPKISLIPPILDGGENSGFVQLVFGGHFGGSVTTNAVLSIPKQRAMTLIFGIQPG